MIEPVLLSEVTYGSGTCEGVECKPADQRPPCRACPYHCDRHGAVLEKEKKKWNAGADTVQRYGNLIRHPGSLSGAYEPDD
jgi:hypothetical protein